VSLQTAIRREALDIAEIEIGVPLLLAEVILPRGQASVRAGESIERILPSSSCFVSPDLVFAIGDSCSRCGTSFLLIGNQKTMLNLQAHMSILPCPVRLSRSPDESSKPLWKVRVAMRIGKTCLYNNIALVVFSMVFFVHICGCGTEYRDTLPVVHASSDEETIVLIRHGELAANGLGQLNCKGYRRANLLPQVLIPRFGAANAIFAPNPSFQIKEGKPCTAYSYVRPLATIEPTAILLGLPVNTQIAFSDVSSLQAAVTNSIDAKSTIYIAWEHSYANKFAKNMLTSYGQDPSVVPTWASNDFDMIYVFHIAPPETGSSGPGQLTFEVEHEGLNDSLESSCAIGTAGQTSSAP
jgi:hypothetical protein